MVRADLDRAAKIGVAVRAGLALIAVAGVFALVALPLLATLQSGFVLYVGLADLFTFVVFALPVVCVVPGSAQLRYWYLLMLASIVFMFGVLGYLLHETPWALLQEPNGAMVIPCTGLIIAIGSCGAYLYLLQKAAVRSTDGDLTREISDETP